MRLSLHSDYALRLLMLLASRDGAQPTTIADVAGRYAISRSHLMKVAQELSRLGFVDAQRGRAGGMRLARAPEEISVGAVVRAMEPDFAIVECLQADGGACLITPACRLKRAFREAAEAFLAALDGYSLADLVGSNAPLKRLLQPEDAR